MINKLTNFLLISSLFFSFSLEAETPWKLRKQDDGIAIYVRNIPNSKMKSFKGMVTIPTRLSSLLAVFADTSIYPRLFYQCKSAKSLKSSENEAYTYVVTDMPWPVSSRDSITHSVITQDEGNKKVTIKISSKPNMLPKKPGFVRVKDIEGSWELTPLKDGTVKIVYKLNINPGGNIPAWLVNLLIVDTPFHTLKNLRKVVKEPKYKNAKR